MSTQTTDPRTRPILGWMKANGDRLGDLLAEEAGGGGDLGPAGDAAIRAHLRFVAEALAETAGGDLRGPLAAFADDLPAELADPRELLETIDLIGAAAAHELRLQFGDAAAEDHALGEMVERRIRIDAWQRVFLRALEDALGPEAIAADATLAWMSERQTMLADTIFAMDRRAKQVEIARGGADAVADTATVNRIGQAAALHAHTRFLVDALAATLPKAA
jgi:hypothetical protein